MSPNSPYKSRLFNYLSSQSVRLKDRLQRGLRHLQNAAALGAQILLYPLYLLVQAGRMTRRQMEQGSQKLPRLGTQPKQALEADGPITKILATIEPYLVISEDATTLRLHQILNPYHQPSPAQFLTAIEPKEITFPVPPPANSTQLQGLATILSNRHLALVGCNNLVLDILSVEQQQKLEKRIRLEIANYYYQKRLATKINQKVSHFVPALKPANQNVLAPIRVFWQIMRWEQRSDIAISINLFGEATLVPLTPSLPRFTPATFGSNRDKKMDSENWWEKIQLNIPLTNLSTEQAQKFDTKIYQSSEYLASQAWQLQQLIQAAIEYFYGWVSRTAPLLKERDKLLPPATNPNVTAAFKERLQSLSLPFSSSLDAPENPFAVQVLIFAAIEYFFGQQQQGLQGNNGDMKQLSEGDDDPWLMWEDLYPEVTPTAPTPDVKTTSSLPKNSPQPPALNATVPQSPIKSPLAEQTLAQPSPNSPVTSQGWQGEKFDIDDNQWIDAEAEPVGYVKHPLETILGWLDRAILWLEELALKIYNWFRAVRQKRKRRKR